MALIRYFFEWYSGSVWSNLIASLVWSIIVGVPAFLWGRRGALRHVENFHNRLDNQDATLASHEARLRAVHEHIKKKL